MPYQPPSTGPNRMVWVYAYEIQPPQQREGLVSLRAVLDAEQTEARSRARTWESRLVTEEKVTHILVVSDSPEQELDPNRRVEAALRALGFEYSITAPLQVVGNDGSAEASAES
jgi:uncharacterized protein YbjT (DUF2867 family)